MGTLKLELATGYLLTASRVGAWAVVSAMVIRLGNAGDFENLSVARSASTLIAYLGLALSPVLLRELIAAARPAEPLAVLPLDTSGDPRLSYAPAAPANRSAALIAAAIILLFAGGLVLTPVVVLASVSASGGGGMGPLLTAMMVAVGMLSRAAADALPGTLLQSRGRLWWDQTAQAVTEWAWPVLTYALWMLARPPGSSSAEIAALAFFLAAQTSILVRAVLARLATGGTLQSSPAFPRPTRAAIKLLSASAGLLLLAHLADFCYAPAVQLLLGRLAPDGSVAAYAPAVQVDAALLLLTAAVSAVVLPRMTSALAAGDVASVRRDYLRGTFACLGILLVAAVPVAVFARPLLQAWLGEGLPPDAAPVLPLVLIHTVLGGASGVGRAVILAAGRYRTYALTSLSFGLAHAGGVAGVLLLTDWGVRGAVAVTIAVVVARCVVWMPWYVLRILARPPLPTARPANSLPPPPPVE